jgi:uncharacterized phiE125 gp8 family phage protein
VGHVVRKLETAPTTEPVTLGELRTHMRLEETKEDTYCESLITAARMYVENRLLRQLITATWHLHMDSFPSEISLMPPPIASVTHIKYYDVDNVQRTLTLTVPPAATDDYIVSTDPEPGQIHLGYNKSWPIVYDRTDAIEVQYVAGYGAASAVPMPIRQAIMILAAHWFENRELVALGLTATSIPLSAEALLGQYRIAEYPA